MRLFGIGGRIRENLLPWEGRQEGKASHWVVAELLLHVETEQKWAGGSCW